MADPVSPGAASWRMQRRLATPRVAQPNRNDRSKHVHCSSQAPESDILLSFFTAARNTCCTAQLSRIGRAVSRVSGQKEVSQNRTSLLTLHTSPNRADSVLLSAAECRASESLNGSQVTNIPQTSAIEDSEKNSLLSAIPLHGPLFNTFLRVVVF